MSMLVTVKMQMPGEDRPREYEVSEEALRVVVAWAGSAAETADLLGKNRSQIDRLLHDYPQMKEMIANRYLLRADRALLGVEGAMAGRDELMRFWTRMMYDPEVSTSSQLAASVNLAKALGMFVERREVVTEDVTGVKKTVQQRLEALRERNEAIAMYGEWVN